MKSGEKINMLDGMSQKWIDNPILMFEAVLPEVFTMYPKDEYDFKYNKETLEIDISPKGSDEVETSVGLNAVRK